MSCLVFIAFYLERSFGFVGLIYNLDFLCKMDFSSCRFATLLNHGFDLFSPFTKINIHRYMHNKQSPMRHHQSCTELTLDDVHRGIRRNRTLEKKRNIICFVFQYVLKNICSFCINVFISLFAVHKNATYIVLKS